LRKSCEFSGSTIHPLVDILILSGLDSLAVCSSSASGEEQRPSRICRSPPPLAVPHEPPLHPRRAPPPPPTPPGPATSNPVGRVRERSSLQERWTPWQRDVQAPWRRGLRALGAARGALTCEPGAWRTSGSTRRRISSQSRGTGADPFSLILERPGDGARQLTGALPSLSLSLLFAGTNGRRGCARGSTVLLEDSYFCVQDAFSHLCAEGV
jgi:hypothetical protein